MSCDPAARCHLKEQRDLLRSAVRWPVIIDLWILAVTAVWMFVPGMALAAAIVGRPSFWIVPVAPAFTILLVAWLGIALSRVGPNAIHDLRLAMLVATVTLVVVAGIRMWFWGRGATFGAPSLTRRRVWIAAAVGIAIGAMIGVAVLATTHLWIRGIPQYFDSPWHGYLIATIERRGFTAPWQLTPLDTYTTSGMTPYPYGFHLLAAISDFTSAPNVALNAVAAVGSILVVPTGAAALAASIYGRRYLAIAFLPIALMLVPAFQMRLTLLAPYGLAITLMPVTIACLLRLRDRPGMQTIVLAAVSMAAIVIVQPAVLLLVIVAVAPPLLASLFRPGRGKVLLGSAWTAVLFLLVSAPWIIQSLRSANSVLSQLRNTRLNYQTALVSVLTTVDGKFAIPWLVIGLSVIGLVLALWARLPRWLIVSWILAVVMYVVAAAGPNTARRVVSGPFFTDWYRIAPLAALLIAALAAGALSALFGLLRGRFHWRTPIALIIVSALTAIATIQLTVTDRHLVTLSVNKHGLTSEDVIADSAHMARFVPGGSQVLNDWRDRSTWFYSLGGIPVLNPWDTTVIASPARQLLLTHFAEIGKSAKVDAALLAFNVRSVVISQNRIFGLQSIHIPVNSPYVHLVHNFGNVQFYSVDLDLLAKHVGVAPPSEPTDGYRLTAS